MTILIAVIVETSLICPTQAFVHIFISTRDTALDEWMNGMNGNNLAYIKYVSTSVTRFCSSSLLGLYFLNTSGKYVLTLKVLNF